MLLFFFLILFLSFYYLPSYIIYSHFVITIAGCFVITPPEVIALDVLMFVKTNEVSPFGEWPGQWEIF